MCNTQSIIRRELRPFGGGFRGAAAPLQRSRKAVFVIPLADVVTFAVVELSVSLVVLSEATPISAGESNAILETFLFRKDVAFDAFSLFLFCCPIGKPIANERPANNRSASDGYCDVDCECEFILSYHRLFFVAVVFPAFTYALAEKQHLTRARRQHKAVTTGRGGTWLARLLPRRAQRNIELCFFAKSRRGNTADNEALITKRIRGQATTAICRCERFRWTQRSLVAGRTRTIARHEGEESGERAVRGGRCVYRKFQSEEWQ